MIRSPRLSPPAVALALALAAPTVARAQVVPGTAQPPGGTIGEEPKPEGAAEAAPQEPGQIPTPPVLPPWPGQRKKQYQVFELDGYFRLRTAWMSSYDQGFHDLGNGTPFPEPITCQTEHPDCDSTHNTSDMRLRLEPVINVSEKVAVKAQIDVLDNLVLGSTPRGYGLAGNDAAFPTGAFDGEQEAVDLGRNSTMDSVRVKRAWAEVMTPLGLLRFGRMPSHWGLGSGIL